MPLAPSLSPRQPWGPRLLAHSNCKTDAGRSSVLVDTVASWVRSSLFPVARGGEMCLKLDRLPSPADLGKFTTLPRLLPLAISFFLEAVGQCGSYCLGLDSPLAALQPCELRQ